MGFRAKIAKSKSGNLKKTLQYSYITLLFIALIPTIYANLISQLHTRRYEKIITNVNTANTIIKIAKNDIPSELWNIVCGKKDFDNALPYVMMADINSGIDQMYSYTKNTESREKLEVATRASTTLLNNIAMLNGQIKAGASVTQNEESLDEIRTITALVSDIMQDFIMAEIESAYKANISTKNALIVLTAIQIFITVFAMFFSIYSYVKVLNEIDILIKKNMEEQKNFQKAEMKALQAQITPHFLYNTFDTIVWLAEEEKTDEVVRITKAFSDFLRISLSRGHEWITISQELDHIRNYLTIQKIRYADILNYSIDADEDLMDFKIIKLVLQPLVENAIYHGIKNKRGRGQLKVSVHYTDDSHKAISFVVEDNGAGFTEERLSQVREELSTASQDSEKLTSVYGLYNVNKKLKLYYGDKTEGLIIESEAKKGSRISFTVPVKEEGDV